MILQTRKGIKCIWGLLAVLLFASVLLLPMKHIQAKQTGSITLEYAVDNVNFDLYRIGVADQKGGYILDEPYNSFGIDLEADNIAATLQGYVQNCKLKPLASTLTTADGMAVFKDVTAGVYLALGETVTVDNVIYIANPILVEVPQNLEGKVTWDVIVKDKSDKQPITELTVLKVWKDNNSKSRPTSIEVTLTKNGEDVETVTLNKKNNWRYTWEDLDNSEAVTWNVVEKNVPTGYKVSTQRNKTVIAITNTKSDGTTKKPKGRIPQTGQLWWPIPILAFTGLICLILGLYRRSKHEK